MKTRKLQNSKFIRQETIQPIRETADSASFRKLLRTHYFSAAFCVVFFTMLYLRFTFTLTFVMHRWSRL